MNEPKAEPFAHPNNIVIGNARVIYGPRNVGWSTMGVFHLPGQRIATDRSEAIRVAKAMNELMGFGLWSKDVPAP